MSNKANSSMNQITAHIINQQRTNNRAQQENLAFDKREPSWLNFDSIQSKKNENHSSYNVARTTSFLDHDGWEEGESKNCKEEEPQGSRSPYRSLSEGYGDDPDGFFDQEYFNAFQQHTYKSSHSYMMGQDEEYQGQLEEKSGNDPENRHKESADSTSDPKSSKPNNDASSNQSAELVGWEAVKVELPQLADPKQDPLFAAASLFDFDWKKMSATLFKLCVEQGGYQNTMAALVATQNLANHGEGEDQNHQKNRRFRQKEDIRIIQLVEEYGLDWKTIADMMHDRKPLEIKNRFYYLKRKNIVDQANSFKIKVESKSSEPKKKKKQPEDKGQPKNTNKKIKTEKQSSTTSSNKPIGKEMSLQEQTESNYDELFNDQK